MANRKERLETELIASDKASAPIDAVADKMDTLDGRTADVTIDADDKATADVAALTQRIAGLTNDEKKVILTAEARKLERTVKSALTTLGKVDGEQYEAVLEAKDNATAKLSLIKGELDELDRATPDVAIEATDHASGDIQRVRDDVQELDRMTPKIDVEVAADGIDSIVEKLGFSAGGVGGIARALASPAGALAGIATGLLIAGTHTADLATEAGTMASLFDTTPELVSGIAAVMRTTADVEGKDLADIVLQMSQALQDSPQHAQTLGVTLEEVRRSPMEAFRKAIDNIARDGKFSFEEMQAASVAFGEEGVRQVAAVVAAVGPQGLSGAIEALPDGMLITQREVIAAREFKAEMSELANTFGGIAQDVGGPVLEILNPILGVLGEAAALVPTITQPLRDLISGERLNSADFSDELIQYVQLLGQGVESAEAWKIALGSMEGFDVWNNKIELANRLIADGLPLNEAMMEAFGAEGDMAITLANALGIVTDSLGDSESANDDAKRSVQEQTEALGRQRDILAEATEALDEYVGAQRSAYDQEVAYREAREDTTSALDDYATKAQAYRDSITADYETTAEAVAAQTDAERERRDAGQEVIDSIVREGDELVELNRRARVAAGGVYSGTEALDDFNGSIAASAASIPDELIPQLVDMVMRINDIPEEKRTEVEAAIRTGDPAVIESTLTNLSRTRTATVNAQKNQAQINQIEAAINHLARDRSAYVGVHGPGSNPGRADNRSDRPVASGEQFTSPGTFRVGEQGEEEIELPRGSRVYSAAATRARDADRARAGGAGSVTNITNLYPMALVPRQVRNADRAYRRAQGPTS